MSITSQVTNKVQEAQDAVTKASANAAAKAGSIADDVSAKYDDTMERAEAALTTVGEQSREIADKARSAGEGLKTTVEGAVREQPVTALLLAVAGGFLIGAMWKGRS
ncbi:hypothetical protein [Methylocystis sp.]|uniref:hypothetical protein n=1 Tax=Methylocystis sp. TaxID=1911079 RepID=UPI0027341EBA|nr:hypothetical protein [Methylocystis sp.]MDP3553390.1 hypothetical protein [Methylocystis sp.]